MIDSTMIPKLRTKFSRHILYHGMAPLGQVKVTYNYWQTNDDHALKTAQCRLRILPEMRHSRLGRLMYSMDSDIRAIPIY